MTRKSGGGPPDRTDESPWQPPGAEQPLQRTVDLITESNEEEPDFIYGDIVHDDEADDPITLVVVNVPGIDASDWEFEDGDTLADRNKKCPEDDDVIIVVPLGTLEDYLPEWDEREVPIKLEQLIEDDVPFAPFPSIRLLRIQDSHLRD